ncbi:MAG TPA: hypothetical protein VMJ75_21615 [Candidatus Acidoferrales bacterium]|nr:hypothetical protein [Candidatus Acidoferrales bacterium]
MTTVAAVFVGVTAAGVWTSAIPAAASSLFPSRVSTAFVAIVATALALLGPGTFSVDARLFGLREIIIPPARRS